MMILMLVAAIGVGCTSSTGSPISIVSSMTTSGVDTLIRQRVADQTEIAIPATGPSLAALPFKATSTCLRCDTGPALAAAVSYIATGRGVYKELAIHSFDELLTLVRQGDGALAPNNAPSPDLETMFFANNLGMATLLLGDALDAEHRQRWTDAVTGGAKLLIKKKELAWYANGNIVIGNTLAVALAYRLSGDKSFLNAYETGLSFALDPDQHRWPGAGFITTKAPDHGDGSDGQGYFTESGKTVGYDPDYTMLQSEQLGRLYLVTKDPVVLRVLNMVVNKLMMSVNVKSWQLDASNGSRHNYIVPEPFDSSALTVLSYRGGRGDLKQYARSELAATATHFGEDLSKPPLGDRGYYALGMIAATELMALNAIEIPRSHSDFLNRNG